jgi:hypothetical protein
MNQSYSQRLVLAKATTRSHIRNDPFLRKQRPVLANATTRSCDNHHETKPIAVRFMPKAFYIPAQHNVLGIVKAVDKIIG